MRDAAASSLSIGFLNWLSVISAITTREITTRFSGGSLGHAWAILIPVSWILAITFFFRWMGREAPIAVSLPVFLATGMLPYLVFRQIITSMMRSLRANRHLLVIGPVRAEDIFTATAVLEMMNAVMVSAVVLGLAAIWSDFPQADSLLTTLWGFALACGLGISLGRCAAIISLISDSATRSELPQWVLDWLWFNPLLHAIEILRSGLVSGFASDFATPFVPIVAIAMLYGTSRLIEAYLDASPGRGARAI